MVGRERGGGERGFLEKGEYVRTYIHILTIIV